MRLLVAVLDQIDVGFGSFAEAAIIIREVRLTPGKADIADPFDVSSALLDLLAPRLLAGPQMMNRRRDARAAPQRIFQVNGTAMLLQKVAERLVGHFLKVLHLVMTEEVELSPGLFVELHAFARHRFCLPREAHDCGAV
jgi:hypothetical protein